MTNAVQTRFPKRRHIRRSGAQRQAVNQSFPHVCRDNRFT